MGVMKESQSNYSQVLWKPGMLLICHGLQTCSSDSEEKLILSSIRKCLLYFLHLRLNCLYFLIFLSFLSSKDPLHLYYCAVFSLHLVFMVTAEERWVLSVTDSPLGFLIPLDRGFQALTSASGQRVVSWSSSFIDALVKQTSSVERMSQWVTLREGTCQSRQLLGFNVDKSPANFYTVI